jgi:magnesium transporter
MITILNTAENKLWTQPEVADGAWVNVVNPSAVEIEETYGLGIPLDFVTDSLNPLERPHTKKVAGTTLILLRIPYFQGNVKDISFTTVPLGIILCYDDIITVCKYEVPFLKQLICKYGQYFSIKNRNRIILRILQGIANQYTDAIHIVNMKADNVEFQKSATVLYKSMKANRKVLEKIQHSLFLDFYSEDADLLEEVITQNYQAF